MAGDEIGVIDLWVDSQLRGNADLVAHVGSRIYNSYAPAEAPSPVVVFQHQSMRDVRGVGSARIMVDTLYVVKAIAQGADYEALRPLARGIDVALTKPNGGAVSGGLVITAVREEPFALIDIDDGRQFRHLGGIFRVYAQAT